MIWHIFYIQNFKYYFMQSINTENRNKYALITGATSGIGYELAKLFAMDGYSLILVARGQERLQQISDELKEQYRIETTPIAKDLFVPGAAEEIYNQVKGMGVVVDALVNDAGQGEWGAFMDTDLRRDIDIIQLNIVALISLTKYFGKDMVARGEGKILQLGSEAGKSPAPFLSVYAATKAFVLSFTAALANELKDTGVSVTALMPGATDTDFFHKAHQEHTVVYNEKELASPEKVAKDGYEALMKGKSRVISGAQAKKNVFMADMVGDTASAEMMKKQMMPSDKPQERNIGHGPSQEERNSIGKKDGDYKDEHKGHAHK